MANNTLILFIGKGQHQLSGSEIYYRDSIYFWDNVENLVQTPFVGEAILRLSPQPFDRVHILGTTQSMWQILFLHCNPNDTGEVHATDNDPLFWELDNAVKSAHYSVLQEKMPMVQDRLADYFSGYCNEIYCSLVPEGRNNTEIFQITNTVLDKISPKDRISLDLTHGLRPQSMLLSYYLAQEKSKAKLANLLYGAFELQQENEGLIPILSYDLLNE